MDLYDRQPYWLIKDGLVKAYNSLDKNIKTDIAIIGAGISGALVAYALRNTGLNISIFDRRHVGMGSTAASTAFLQYEIDTPLNRLIKIAGERNAVASYELCRQAIYDVGAICATMRPEFDFHTRPSLQYASFNKHRAELYQEYLLRKQYGFHVRWLDAEDIKKLFDFDAPGAIFSSDGGEVDAYMLTHALFKTVQRAGHNVYSNTNITDIAHEKKGIKLSTATGLTVRAHKLIIAAGYESLKYVPKKIADIYATYALVSEPLSQETLWHRNSLVWETAMPYMYFRVVDKNRILLGGKDDKFYDPAARNKRIKRKTQMLLHSFSQKMKDVPIKPDFSWAGAFAVTKDGLPYIGTIPQRPHTYFALGYGGNGITFSSIAANIITDMIMGRNNRHAKIFSFDR